MHRRPRLLSAFLIACACSAANAAELGEARVSSHIGQQLVADVELTTLADPNAKLEVRLASPEVYNEAGIAMPPALSTLNLSVMRRDGRQFVHATTLRPVEADHLHLYLELGEHGQHNVRLATLWLTADPHPAAVLPASPAAVGAAVVQARALAAAPAAAAAAAAVVAPPSVPVPAHAAAGAIPASSSARAGLASAVPAPQAAPGVAPGQAVASGLRLPALPFAGSASLPLHLPARAGAGAGVGARPAACTRASAQAQACTVLGEKNAELRSQIGQLEERVKGLQARLGVPQQGGKVAGLSRTAAAIETPAGAPVPAAAAAAAQPAKSPEAHATPAVQAPTQGQPQPPAPAQPQPAKPPKHPAGPKPISAIKPLLPHAPKTASPDAGLPWGAIGAGLAALAAAGAGLALLLVRRKRARKGGLKGSAKASLKGPSKVAQKAAPAGPGRLSRLRERLFTHAPAGRAAEPVAEPRLE